MTSTPELVRRRFSEELTRCCGSYYQSVPSNEQFARDLYLSSKYRLKVSRETVRKWFKGDSFPDLDHLLHLIGWLKLDMTKIFISEKSDDGANGHSSELRFFDTSAISHITPDQIDAFVGLLTVIKDSELLKNKRVQ